MDVLCDDTMKSFTTAFETGLSKLGFNEELNEGLFFTKDTVSYTHLDVYKRQLIIRYYQGFLFSGR